MYNRKLTGYLPPVIGDKENIKALMGAEDVSVGLLWKTIDRLKDEGFVVSAENVGLKRMEEICELETGELTAEKRRLAIILKLMGDRPYTMCTLYDRLYDMCRREDGGVIYGRDLVFEYGKSAYTLEFGIGVRRKELYNEVVKLLLKQVPANIGINAYIIYNRHRVLSELTHRGMKPFTHKQLYEDYVGV